jgi:2-polyprenyl-3-methyl-5-hydroxy-6-metoxy-1,4-benzoquinol methylase
MTGQAEFWDERYRGEGFAFGTEPNVFLASQSHYLKPGLRALLPGDGQGRNGVWLAQRGLLVDTADVSPLAVARAEELAKARGVKLNIELADLTSWTWPQARYDIVAALYVHFFDADRPRMHCAMLGALKPGGILIMEAFRIEQLEMRALHGSGGPKTADLLHSKAKLLSDFEGASILLLEDAIVELDEGHRHKGPAAVVRAVVQKPM